MKRLAPQKSEYPRIFIGTTEIAGYYHNLARGLRELGFHVTFFTKKDHPFQYDVEGHWWLLRLTPFARRKRSKMPRSRVLQKAFWIGIEKLTLAATFLWAVLRYDVFIFGFGRSFVRGGYDLWILKKLKKTIISNIAHGGDARPPYINGSYQSRDGVLFPMTEIYKGTKFIKKRIERIEKESDYVICAPYSCHFLKGDFINSLELGVPWHFDEVAVSLKDDSEDDEIYILHAPSHLAAKGTGLIRKAINRLRKKGYKIEYTEITGRPHKDVLNELKRCTFVVDQLYSDTPLAGFATEAAWFGKPAVVGGCALKELKRFIDEEMFPPSQICHPEDLEAAIDQLIVDPEYCKRLGESARDFVKSHWTARQVASKYARMITGDIPYRWFINPYQVVYLSGAGLSEEQCKTLVRKMIECYGLGALQLSHRPDLEAAFIQFANSVEYDQRSETSTATTSSEFFIPSRT